MRENNTKLQEEVELMESIRDENIKLKEALKSRPPVKTTNGDRLVFNKHKNTIFSNFSLETPVKIYGQSFQTRKKAYQWACAVNNGDDATAEKISESTTPEEAKDLSREIRKSKEWDNKKVAVMRQIVKAAIRQNQNLHDELMTLRQDSVIEELRHK